MGKQQMSYKSYRLDGSSKAKPKAVSPGDMARLRRLLEESEPIEMITATEMATGVVRPARPGDADDPKRHRLCASPQAPKARRPASVGCADRHRGAAVVSYPVLGAKIAAIVEYGGWWFAGGCSRLPLRESGGRSAFSGLSM
jgi:hypothetical protein